jgi:hypothetical protein
MTCAEADELAMQAFMGLASSAQQSRLEAHVQSCSACSAAAEMIRAAQNIPAHEFEGQAVRGAMSRIRSQADSARAANLERFDRFGILNMAALAATVLIIAVTIHRISIQPSTSAAMHETAASNNSAKRSEKTESAAEGNSDPGPHPLLNKLAPCPKLGLFDGGKFDLARHQGREVVVLHFGSDEFYSFKYVTALAKVLENYQFRDVIAYDVREKCDAEHLKRFAQDHASFLLKHVIVDAGRKLSKLYEVGDTPLLFVIDREGKVCWTHRGVSEPIEITLPAVLDKVLAQPSWTDLPHVLIGAVDAQDIGQLQGALYNGHGLNSQDDWGATALMRAAWLGSKPMTDLLIEKGAQVNTQDHQQWTALMFAAENGSAGIVDRLLKAGADPQAQNSDGWTASQLAVLNGHTQIADTLSGGKGSDDSLDVFLKAVEFEKAPIVASLLAHGAKVNARKEKGENALAIAIEKGNAEIVKLLLKNGADPNAIISGKSMLERAREHRHKEIIQFLTEAGAK